MRYQRRTILVWAAFFLAALSSLRAGPPYLTDDPEPVEYQNWEFYVASEDFHTTGDWTGTLPHLELNYGVISNVQLHVIAPLSFNAPAVGAAHYGPGTLELGVKFRFIQETNFLPQVGIFPLLEVPLGSESDGLGTGHLQALLPLWLQKSFGEWTIYGGGGYGINGGAGNEDWGFGGVVLQRQVTKNVAIGGEIYHQTAMQSGGRFDTSFNLGTVIDFTEHQHLLFSAGRSIHGPTDFQCYLAWQFTFGPEFFHSFAGASGQP
jgi:hypothetical protein